MNIGKQNKPLEKSYIDMLVELHEAIESDDCMPSKDKDDILRRIEVIEVKIEKYSA